MRSTGTVMRSRPETRWVLFAFVYAAVVLYGLLRVWPVVPVTRDSQFLPTFALVAAGVAAVLSGFTRADTDTVLAAMVSGVVLAFGGASVVDGALRSYTLIYGAYALGFVAAGWCLGSVAGWFLGATVSSRGFNVRVRGVLATSGIVLVLAFATALVGPTPRRIAVPADVYFTSHTVLLGLTLGLGFGAVWWGDFRLRIFLPLVSTLPFVVLATRALAVTLATVVDHPFSNARVFDEALLTLGLWVVVLIVVGAILARSARHFEPRKRTVTDTDSL